ncbi:hypothetical protein SO802_004179 [Lithocarpus litseifolius]|uniref:Uncharacterized protein n=1 Tax=Lithocarpus litseifolius TaxID=425828 RepID=A0AAW2E654_9ROSI
MAHLPRAQIPDQAESPATSRLDPLGPKDQRDLQTTSLFSDPSTFVINRTNQAEVKDKTKVSTTQLTPRSHYRYSQSQQKARGAAGLKEFRQKQSLEGKAAAPDTVFNFKTSKPIVFSAGSSMKPNCDISSDMDTPTRGSDDQGESLSGIIRKDPLRGFSNDQSTPGGDMEDRIVATTHNVSAMVLKRIDPKLRPPKKKAEASTSPRAIQGEDIMIQKNLADDFAQEKLKKDSDGMQIEDGGEPSVSD